jgi:peroxiredoxin Q/BCP
VKKLTAFAVVALLAACLNGAEDKAPAKAEEGKQAPAFDLPATNIKSVLPDAKDKEKLALKDFAGKKNVVLFFYPKASTKGCTIESCGFRDKTEDFAKLDTVIIGISNDKIDAQQKFTDDHKLSFPLLADVDKKVSKAYGTANEKGGPKRYTFVIDKKGVVRKIYTKVAVADHPAEVLKYVKDELK